MVSASMRSFPSHSPLPPHSRERFSMPTLTVHTAHGEQVRSRDGRELWLREIAPNDEAALQRCFQRLSPEDIRHRFLHAMSELPAPMARRLCNLDTARETALVLVDATVKPAEIRGVGRIYVDPTTDSAEFSVIVEHAWSRVGLGALLMQRLVDDCRLRGLAEIWGYVLQENRPMLDLCKELGFTQHLIPDEPGTAQICLRL